MSGYKKLKVWELSHALTLEIYKMTEKYPQSETYGIVSQMSRAAYSVPSNIIEGKSRETDKELKRYLIIARGSIEKLSYFLLLSRDLGLINDVQYDNLSDKTSHIGSMLNNLIKKIRIVNIN